MKFSTVALTTVASLALSAPYTAAFAGCNIETTNHRGFRARRRAKDNVHPRSKGTESEKSSASTALPNLRSRSISQFGGIRLPAISGGKDEVVAAGPLADLPMRRLRLPEPAAGRDYVLVQLKVGGKGPFDFMLDSGLTTEMITPHLQQTLGITGSDTVIKGLAAGGDASGGALIDLSGVSVCGGEFADLADELALPPLHAVVADFPQEHLDPSHDPVEGMLGMEMLNLFDTDFDFPAGRIRLWAPGTAAKESARAGLVAIPDVVLNETLLLGMRVASAKKPGMQPVVGIIDCGSAFSALNWAAADYFGLPPRQDKTYRGKPSIFAVGVDGRPMTLPTTDVEMTFVGNPSKDESGRVQFAPAPKSWRPWDPVQVAIGDLPVFSALLGDGITPYKGPAALIGLDILSQRRVILETSTDMGRTRRLFVSPK